MSGTTTARAWADLNHDERAGTLRAMQCFGGGFVARLAAAWTAADEIHSEVLGAAFHALVKRYGPASDLYRAAQSSEASDKVAA